MLKISTLLTSARKRGRAARRTPPPQLPERILTVVAIENLPIIKTLVQRFLQSGSLCGAREQCVSFRHFRQNLLSLTPQALHEKTESGRLSLYSADFHLIYRSAF